MGRVTSKIQIIFQASWKQGGEIINFESISETDYNPIASDSLRDLSLSLSFYCQLLRLHIISGSTPVQNFSLFMWVADDDDRTRQVLSTCFYK